MIDSQPNSTESEYMRKSEICREARVCERTVDRMIERGDLIAYKFGKTVLVKRSDLLAAFKPVNA